MKSADLKFSIITVVKNSEKKILRTLCSVSSQTFKNYEHIIIDGFSNDNTFSIVKNFENQKINFEQYNDKNLYDGINFAIKKTRGTYIIFLHAGDIFFSDKTLENINQKILHNTDLLLGGCVYFNPSNMEITRTWEVNSLELTKYNSYKIPHTGSIISKKIVNKIGEYNVFYQISSDTDYLIRLFSIKNLNAIILYDFVCFMEIGGLSTSYKNFFIKALEDIKIYFKYFKFRFCLYYFLKLISKLNHYFTKKNKKIYTDQLKQLIKENK